MTKLYSILLVVTSVLCWGACSSDDNGSTDGTGGDAITGASGQSGMTMLSSGIGGGGVSGQGELPVDSGTPDDSVTSAGGIVAASTDGTVAGIGGAINGGADTGLSDTGVAEASPEAAVSDAVVTEEETDPDFEACIDTLKPNCSLMEMDTAEKMEVPCKAMTVIAVPLSNGDTYGPMTVTGGPYGSMIEWNEGAGTEFVNPINGAESTCSGIISSFGEPDVISNDLKNRRSMDQSIYTIFRPACMRQGEKYPVITWANGTCGYTHGYTFLLAHLASHGYVVVVSNSTWTGTPPTNTVQLRALDYAAALNADPNSIYYQRLDLDNIGAMGHSQGAQATATAASDQRIKSIILWNSGTSSNKPFLNVSGERDIGDRGASGMETSTNSAIQPGAWVYYNQVLVTGGGITGHLVLMMQPERVVDMNLAWWDWRLKGSQDARNMFLGDDCGLCNRDAEFNYGHNSLLQQ